MGKFKFTQGLVRQSEAGQAMPLALVFLVVLCVGLLVTFNTGQVVGKKVELTNTADAAAYSVAAEQARAWNIAAYMNRGRVANEVAVAQIVSLNSWLTQINVTMQNIEDVVKVLGVFFPPLEAAGQAINAAEEGFRTVRNNVLRPGSDVAIGGLDQLNSAYAKLAQEMVEEVGTVDAVDTARDVVKDNSPKATMTVDSTALLVTKLTTARSTYLQGYDVPGGAGRRSEGGDRYRNVVMQSRDEFTRDRKDEWIVLDANGGTDLVDYDRWSAVDVNEIDLSIGLDAFKIPVGWGGAQAVNGRQPKFFPGIRARKRGRGEGWDNPYENNRRYQAYNGVKKNGIAGEMIDNVNNGWPRTGGKKKDAYFKGYRNGIAHYYYDTKKGKAETPAPGEDAGPIYTVEVETGIGEARTSSKIGIGAGRMELKDSARDNKMRAMSSAQVYFSRPYNYAPFKRMVWGNSDRMFERGNLFSPYWQARLVETPATTRATLSGI